MTNSFQCWSEPVLSQRCSPLVYIPHTFYNINNKTINQYDVWGSDMDTPHIVIFCTLAHFVNKTDVRCLSFKQHAKMGFPVSYSSPPKNLHFAPFHFQLISLGQNAQLLHSWSHKHINSEIPKCFLRLKNHFFPWMTCGSPYITSHIGAQPCHENLVSAPALS